jgi:ribosomal protein L11 methyltransferase
VSQENNSRRRIFKSKLPMEYLQIHFTPITETQSEILIAQLNEIGFDGFEEETNELKAFIPSANFKEDIFNLVVDINILKYTKSIIKKENWNAIWEADFEPIEVAYPNSTKPFVYIRADFHEAKDGFEYDIVVTPKMSFGTGHHATTFLMVQQMSQIDFVGKTVIDFGTGTGVLAILADKMGAKHILGIDCDDWSIENAEENVAINNCKNIQLLKAETIPTQAEKADIILANINLNIISENILAIKNAVKQNGIILFSGIMLHDEANIINVIEKERITIKEIFRKDNWLALMCVNG